MDLERFFAEHGYAETTETTYRWNLDNFDKYLQNNSLKITSVTSVDLRRWIKSHNWKQNTAYNAACAVKAYLRFIDPTHPALAFKIKQDRNPQQRVVSPDNLRQIYDILDTSTGKGIRDRATIDLMLDTGLRRFEIVGLLLRNLFLSKQYVVGKIKGGIWGRAVFSKITASHIKEWLEVRDQYARPDTTTIFVSTRGTTPGASLTPDGLKSIYYKLGEKADVAFSPHDLRRSFATISIRNGAPTRVVQKAGRWKNIQMVERYSPDITAEDMEPYFPVPSLE